MQEFLYEQLRDFDKDIRQQKPIVLQDIHYDQIEGTIITPTEFYEKSEPKGGGKDDQKRKGITRRHGFK